MKKLLSLLLLILVVACSLTSCADASDISLVDNAASTLEFNFYEVLKVTTTKQVPDTFRNAKSSESPDSYTEAMQELKSGLKELTNDYTVIENKDASGKLVGSLTIYNCKDTASAEQAKDMVLPFIKDGLICEIYNETKVIIGKTKSLTSVTMPDGVDDMVVAEKKDDQGNVKDKITIYYCDKASSANTLYNSLQEQSGELDVGISTKKVYIGTAQALTDATSKHWFNQIYHTFVEGDRYTYVLKGLGYTIIITLGALLIGVILGALVAVAKYYAEGNPRLKIVNIICDGYTTIIRGIPMMVLLLIFYFIILFGTNKILISVIAFGINSGAYMAELIRSGINAVDKGQMEAARSLGMSKWQAMRTIIFPQAIKNILPAIGNECIALLKETSVAGYIGVEDLTRGVFLIRNNTYDSVNPLVLSAIIYLALVLGLAKLIAILERRLKRSDGRHHAK